MSSNSYYLAGAAVADITPADSQFLFGYPHVKRYSTGVHDPLLSSALYLGDGRMSVLWIANDIIFVPRSSARRAREMLAARTGIPPENIMITATHTHSGPLTMDYISNRNDAAVPPVDPRYLAALEDGIIRAGETAWRLRAPAELTLAVADGSVVGGNRRDPAGPANPRVPVLIARTPSGGAPIACMLVCAMHPTVLHEDSTLVSADFPGMTRQALQRDWLGVDCPVLHHTGPAGNQSPRHVTRANTFAEAERLGELLARNIISAAADARLLEGRPLIDCRWTFCELPPRSFPSVADAAQRLEIVRERLERLRRESAPAPEVRTAECDWFGAEETLTLAQAAATGELERVRAACMPVEIQAIGVGDTVWVGWPGECFVEFALAVRQAYPEAEIISLANGELQGYLVTPEAALEGGYEASNALFSADGGAILIEATRRLLAARRSAGTGNP